MASDSAFKLQSGKTCFGKAYFVVGFLSQCVKFESCFL